MFGQIELSGVVSDTETNQPLPGATIKIIGTDIGTMADINGKFVLSHDYTINTTDSMLSVEIRFIGYHPETLKVHNGDTLQALLSPDLSLFKDHKIKNSVDIGYYGDMMNAPYGVDTKYYLQGIGELFLNFDLQFRYFTDNRTNNGKMFSFNYEIPGGHHIIPDNFHISNTRIDYGNKNFTMNKTTARLTNVWRLFAIDYGVDYRRIDSLPAYYSFNSGFYLNLEGISWRLRSFETFVHLDYGNDQLLYDAGVTKLFYFRRFTSISLTMKYFDYNYIAGTDLSVTFAIFSTNRMLCCYSWRPEYE